LTASVREFLANLPFIDRGIDFLHLKPLLRRRALARQLQAALQAAGSEVESIDVRHGETQQPYWQAGVGVREKQIALTISPGVEQSREYWYLLDRLPGVLHLAGLAGADLDFVADVSDGHMGHRNVLGFCANHDSVRLIPDPDFFNSRGYRELRQQASPDWSGRSSEIIWRGSPNGQGQIANAAMNPDDPDLIQRVRMCLLLRGQQGMDVRLVMSVRTDHLSDADCGLLEQAGIVGQPIARSEWWQRRFAIDIDGYTNAWSSLFVRLLMGCCVLKVASPTGHRQWYYHRLEPWQHYIPFAADLSDLMQQIEWCRAHDAECEQIANRGRELALSMDFDTEYQRTAQALLQSAAVNTTAESRR
jgi:hypothetical protein